MIQTIRSLGHTEEQRRAGGFARLDHNQVVTRAERVGISGLRFHCNAGGMLGCGELRACAHLERSNGFIAANTDLLAVGTGEHCRDGTVFGMLQIGPCIVERLLGKQSVFAQIVFGTVNRLGAGRNEVLVYGDVRASRQREAAFGVVLVDLGRHSR